MFLIKCVVWVQSLRQMPLPVCCCVDKLVFLLQKCNYRLFDRIRKRCSVLNCSFCSFFFVVSKQRSRVEKHTEGDIE